MSSSYGRRAWLVFIAGVISRGNAWEVGNAVPIVENLLERMGMAFPLLIIIIIIIIIKNVLI